MRKIIIFLFFILVLIHSSDINAIESLDSYLNKTGLVPAGDMEIGKGGFKYLILKWVRNIGGFLGLAAVGSIVYGAFLMVLSGGEEEKVKNGKKVVTWGILGFFAVVVAASIIAIIVNFMYSLG